jgi:hypothetical protein
MTETKENPRKAIQEARKRRLAVIEGPPRTVKVFAANEALRGALRHANGTRFRSKLDQGIEWPNDAFTARRIAEGSVLTEASGGGEAVEPDPTKNARENAAAQKPQPKAEPEPKAEPVRSSRRSEPQPPATA